MLAHLRVAQIIPSHGHKQRVSPVLARLQEAEQQHQTSSCRYHLHTHQWEMTSLYLRIHTIQRQMKPNEHFCINNASKDAG